MLAHHARLTVLAALLLTGTVASATEAEPNGLRVPLFSTSGETSLNTFFASQLDPVDWQADAARTPSAFFPECGVSTTLLLHDSARSTAFGWYNVTGALPGPNDIHLILPAGAQVGTTASGPGGDIRSDPAYQGGLVGFALVGTEAHFANPDFNVVCSGCHPQGNWIAALVYPSRLTPDTYYVAFEDGPFSSTDFGNDGDFNDAVVRITNVTCAGGNQPCQSGKPGACAAGMTRCSRSGIVCQQLAQPAEETCNGIDDDCNGLTDEGASCGDGLVCDRGACVPSCLEGGSCPASKQCGPDGRCIDPACANVDCPVGKLCVGGACRGPCDGVTCPHGTVCRAGACVDPCRDVTCASGEVCEAGTCLARCPCAPCVAGLSCDEGSGRCVEPACTGMSCGARTHCQGGACVDDCAGATCPAGQSCRNGLCQDPPAPEPIDAGTGTPADAGNVPPEPDAGGGADLDAGNTAPDAGADEVDAGNPTPDAGGDEVDAGTDATIDAGSEPFVDAGAEVVDAGRPPAADAGTPDAGENAPSNGGCGCDASGSPATLLLLGLARLARRRRG